MTAGAAPLPSDVPRTPAATAPPSRASRFVRRLMMAAAVAAGLYLLWLLVGEALRLVLLVFAGVLVAVIFDTAARALSRLTGWRRGWSLAAAVLAAAALLAAGLWLFASALTSDFERIADNVMASAQRLEEQLAATRWGRAVLRHVPTAEEVLPSRAEAPAVAASLLEAALTALGEAVLVVFVGLYLSVNPGVYIRGFLRLVPPAHRPKAAAAFAAAGRVLRHWLAGQLLLMAIVGVLTWLGLLFIGVETPLGLGLITGTLEFIPYLGPLLSFVLVSLMVFGTNPGLVPAVALLFLGIHAVEGYVLTPLVQRKAVSLPPALTIVAQVLFGRMAGPLGLAVATPLVALLSVLVENLYVGAVLGEPPAGDVGPVRPPAPP